MGPCLLAAHSWAPDQALPLLCSSAAGSAAAAAAVAPLPPAWIAIHAHPVPFQPSAAAASGAGGARSRLTWRRLFSTCTARSRCCTAI